MQDEVYTIKNLKKGAILCLKMTIIFGLFFGLVFGNTTIEAVKNKGLRVDIAAPTPETPSMTMALEKYIQTVNKK